MNQQPEMLTLDAIDDLPVIEVKGRPRPRGKLSLDGRVFIVKRPKEMVLSHLISQASKMQTLAKKTPTAEELAEVTGYLTDFINSCFASGDRDEVVELLMSPDNDVEAKDLADGVAKLIMVWKDADKPQGR